MDCLTVETNRHLFAWELRFAKRSKGNTYNGIIFSIEMIS